MANLTVSSAVDTLMQATNQAGLRSACGLVIGTDVQAYSALLAAVAGMTPTDGVIIVGNGTTFVAESGATARTSLGLGSLATASTISNSNWSGTDLAVVNGGTGASDAAGARTNLGLVIGTNVQAYSVDLAAIAALAKTDGNIIVGNGSTWVAESGSTARASIGAMSATEPYHIQVALSANGAAIAAGTKKGVARVPKAGNITAFVVDCDPANEPSAAAVQVDLNKIDRSTGTATTVLSAVAEIATSANTSTGGTINGTQAVSAGDMLTLDIDQGSDGKELLATITITPT